MVNTTGVSCERMDGRTDGRQVAAKAEGEPHWILATVEKHNEKKGVFGVVDDDAGEDARRSASPQAMIEATV